MMRTIITLGLVFVAMVSDVVVARPEPLPMFLVNRAIKAPEFVVKEAYQDEPIIPAAGKGSADPEPNMQILNENSKTSNDKILPDGESHIFIVKDRIENDPAIAHLVSSFPTVESKLNDNVGSEISIDQTEVNISPTENRASNAEKISNNEITTTVARSTPSEDNKDQTASPAEKLVVKKAPTHRPLKSRKINKVASLNRLHFLESLIDFLFDSLIPTNGDFRRDQRTHTADEYLNYAFPSVAYDFYYF